MVRSRKVSVMKKLLFLLFLPLVCFSKGTSDHLINAVNNIRLVPGLETEVSSNLVIENQNELRLEDLLGTFYLGFKSPSVLSGNQTFTLPDGDGTSNQVLQTNGSGVLNWTDFPTFFTPSNDNRLVRTDIGGDIQESGITVDDTDTITGVTAISLTGTSLLNFTEISEPSTPAATTARVYFDSTEKKLASKDDNGDVIIYGEGGGAGGGLDVFYTQNFEDDVDASSFTTGNNASFLGGGSATVSPANETVSPINGLVSISYTQASGSLNDYGALPAITLSDKQLGNYITVVVNAKYGGDDDDIDLVLYGTTTGFTKTIPVLASSLNTRYEFYQKIPSTETSLRVGYHVKVENIGAELIFDDIELSTNPVGNTSTQKQSTFARGGTTWGSTNSNIRYFSIIEKSHGSGIYTYSSDSTLGTSITLLRQAKVEICYTADFSAARNSGISLNTVSPTTDYQNIAQGEKIAPSVASSDPNTTCATGVFDEGDVFRPHDHVSGATGGTESVLTVSAIADSDSVVIPAETNLTTWADYTPVVSGMGSVTVNFAKWRIVGDTVEVQAKFTAGTVAASEIQIGLPNSYSIATGYSAESVGWFHRGTNADGSVFSILATSGDTYVNAANRNGGVNNIFTPQNGNALIASSDVFSVNFSVKVADVSSIKYLVPYFYEEYSGSWTSGATNTIEYEVVQIMNQVTVCFDFTTVDTGTDATTSSAGELPARFRPSERIDGPSGFSGDTNGTSPFLRPRILSDGTMSIQGLAATGLQTGENFIANTANVNICMSYNL